MCLLNKIFAVLAAVLCALVFASPANAGLSYTFNSEGDVAVIGSNCTASGTLTLSLGFAPSPGTSLTVIKSTGTTPIIGTFDNVPQEGPVNLSFNGITYNFVANYKGGNGRSLVLVWNAVDLQALYGSSTDIPLTANNVYVSGSLTTTLNFAPSPGTNLTVIRNTGMSFIGGTFTNVPQGGIVPLNYNGTIYNFIANYYGGNGRSLVLQWPCIGLDAWGPDDDLGDIARMEGSVNSRGVLAGKTVISISTGGSHNLALTSDGKVFAWGTNSSGQLGNSSTTNSMVPVAVDTTGALAGKTVVAISAGRKCSLALTSDGQVYGWGDNSYGELGNGTKITCSAPVAVSMTGALSGKTVVAIAAGEYHSLALTSDGEVFGWGYNYHGELGNGGNADSLVPVAVKTTGVLAGKMVTSIAVGYLHSLALTSDGQVFGWGYDNYGELGDNKNNTYSLEPVALFSTGALAGKTIVAIAAGNEHSLALSSDGQVFAWGENSSGELGNKDPQRNNSSVPVAVYSSGALSGKIVAAISASYGRSMALTSDGQVFSWGANMSLSISTEPVAISSTGALAGKMVNAISVGGGRGDASHVFAIFGSGSPSIVSDAMLQNVAQTGTGTYSITLTASATDNPPSDVKWQVSTTGSAGSFSDITDNPTSQSGTLSLTEITSSQNGYAYRAVFSNIAGSTPTFAAELTMLNGSALEATLGSGSDAPIQTDSSVFISGSLPLSLNFAPAPGMKLTILENTGLGFITGSFSNIKQGDVVPLSYNGTIYNFIANYYGGNGRSLVLECPCPSVTAWGHNDYGELGNNSLSDCGLPTAVTTTGALAGKRVISVTGGASHSLALSSDGLVYAWGYGFDGELGNSSTYSKVPTAVDISGALAGKTAIAIAAGSKHNLALTADGHVFAWGYNYSGQLGNNSQANSSAPSAVFSDGAMAGKSVVAIAAGDNHSLALTSDGQVFAWGNNSNGQLGNHSKINSLVPVAISSRGAMLGKKVISIAAGESVSLALTSDGLIFGWGNNVLDPVAISTGGVLSGKKIVAIAARRSLLALTSDGQVFSWDSFASTPVSLSATGALAGKLVVSLAAGDFHNLALTSDGQVFAWKTYSYGSNYGQLGATNSIALGNFVPVAVDITGILAGKRVTSIGAGYNHSLATYDTDPLSVAISPTFQKVTPGVPVSFSIIATDNYPTSIQWQVSLTGTGGLFANITDNDTATTGTLAIPNVTSAQDGIAYRAVYSNLGGTSMTPSAPLSVRSFADPLAVYNSASDIPMEADKMIVSGSLKLGLNFAPQPGTNLKVINNTGTAFISGTFNNISQGAIIPLAYNGTTYNFIANYYGGNGRSLVLEWPCTELASWGQGNYGQLANGGTTNSLIPATISPGALAGKKVVSVTGGSYHNLALTSDGQVFSWGYNNCGQLGIGGTTNSTVPLAVFTGGGLLGKRVVAIAASGNHSLALTSEGQVFAWGNNNYGQQGDNSTVNSSVPVLVSSGALTSKTAVAIAAGVNHSLALTSDGQIVAWGANESGQLGNGNTSASLVPATVNFGSAMAGKIIAAIAAGEAHSLALTSDGKVFTWGNNMYGQLGNNSSASSSLPVPVATNGVLYSKRVTAITAKDSCNFALTADGQVFSWGFNTYGELGNNSTANSSVPVSVYAGGGLVGKSVSAIAAGWAHGLVLTSDGLSFGWGRNNMGQLGNGSTGNSNVPVAVNTSGAGKVWVNVAAGDYHSLAMITYAQPSIILNPVSQTGTAGASINFVAAANDYLGYTVQWQVSTSGPDGVFVNIPGNSTAITGTLVLTNVDPNQSGYAYRAVYTNDVGSSTSTAVGLIVQPTYSWFHAIYGSSNPDPTSDPNHTGICNLSAYAFGVNPSRPDRSSLPLVTAQDDHLQISYPRWKNAADLGYVVEVSDDLKTWRSGPGYTEQVSATAIDGAREQVVEEDLTSVSSVPRRFIRVRITH